MMFFLYNMYIRIHRKETYVGEIDSETVLLETVWEYHQHVKRGDTAVWIV